MPIPDLHIRAARFFLLAEQVFSLGCRSYRMFWDMTPSIIPNTAVYLPALAAAVRAEWRIYGLCELVRHPLPSSTGWPRTCSSHTMEAVSWYKSLVTAWEVHKSSADPERRPLALPALVRLDGYGMPEGMERPSCLPEWLAEARRMVRAGSEPARTEPTRTGEWRVEDMKTLAALAAWRPAPGVITHPETLGDWVAFWQEVRQSTDPLWKGIAAKALLNLPEANLQAASIRPVPAGQLLHELAAAIPVAAERTAGDFSCNYLLLLRWQPEGTTSLPVTGEAEVAGSWLEITRHKTGRCRRSAWSQLIDWDRTGSLKSCGIDLLPHFVKVTRKEKNPDVLLKLSQWVPDANVSEKAQAGSGSPLLRRMSAYWQRKRQSRYWLERGYGWMGSIRLYQAGEKSEPPTTFMKSYLSAVAEEVDSDVLFTLAQWTPGPDMPPNVHRKWQEVWQVRMGERDESIRRVAVLAISRQVLEREIGSGLRRVALETWRAGTKGTEEVMRRLGTIASRFHEVQAHLAAGRVPDFEVVPTPPAERRRPQLTLPPGHIAGGEWRMDNGELKMENEKLKMENHEGALAPGNRPAPDDPSR